jgi:hypothetical protein
MKEGREITDFFEKIASGGDVILTIFGRNAKRTVADSNGSF